MFLNKIYKRPFLRYLTFAPRRFSQSIHPGVLVIFAFAAVQGLRWSALAPPVLCDDHDVENLAAGDASEEGKELSREKEETFLNKLVDKEELLKKDSVNDGEANESVEKDQEKEKAVEGFSGINPVFDDKGLVFKVFGTVPEEYHELGFIQRGEEGQTVEPHVYAQAGDITFQGVRKMCAIWLDEVGRWKAARAKNEEKDQNTSQNLRKEESEERGTIILKTFKRKAEEQCSREDFERQFDRDSQFLFNGGSPYSRCFRVPWSVKKRILQERERSEREAREREAREQENKGIVFCDLGSGIGNVCMQVLAEVPAVSKVVGVEVIESRDNYAKQCYGKLFDALPNLAEDRKVGHFFRKNIMEADEIIKNEKVNVIYSHSWMFDDELHNKIAEIAENSGPDMRYVIVSKPLNGLSENKWRRVEKSLESDWNKEAPFIIYSKKADEEN